MGAAENKKLIQDMFAELSKGNAQAFLNNMADDVQFTIMGTTKYSGTCNGKQELLSKVLSPLSAQLEGGLTITPGQFHCRRRLRGDAGARASQLRKHGKSYNNTYCQIFRIVNGKVQQVTEYLDTELVTAAFGK